jgi:ABC-2 type transport system ATP-binding protein
MEPIKIEGMSKVYHKGLRRQKVLAVNDLSMSVPEGEIFGFIGPNGAGKSTTIKILCDLIRPTKGRATILGRNVREPQARTHMGYLPENPSYYSFLAGWELLGFHGAIHSMQDRDIRARGAELLEILDLAEAAHRPLRTYSKGMVQRLGIAAALIHDPKVLIFDEPMSGLDPPGRKLVTDLMLKLRNQEKTVFFSTHILHDVEVVCDRIGIISQGRLKFSGFLTDAISETFSSYELVLRKAIPEQMEFLEEKGLALRYVEDKLKIDVPKEDIASFLDLILHKDVELVSIEPKRLTLQDFFVSFVKQEDNNKNGRNR